MSSVVIVGAGLFGSVAAALCRKAGHNVTVIDCAKPMAASKCSGNLLKPSWLAKLGREKVDGGYQVLRDLYGVQTLQFRTQLFGKTTDIDFVDPALVLEPPDITSEVAQVGSGEVWLVDGKRIAGVKVLVAAGVWSAELVKIPGMKALIGARLLVSGQDFLPHVHLYAPYKHSCAFQISKSQIWVGDSTALIATSWDDTERIQLLNRRAFDFFKIPLNAKRKALAGARPYVEGHKGYFERVSAYTWVSTGGAKNGLLLAAAQAKQFVEAL